MFLFLLLIVFLVIGPFSLKYNTENIFFEILISLLISKLFNSYAYVVLYCSIYGFYRFIKFLIYSTKYEKEIKNKGMLGNSIKIEELNQKSFYNFKLMLPYIIFNSIFFVISLILYPEENNNFIIGSNNIFLNLNN